MTAPRYPATCTVCRGEVPHEVIASVQRGQVFLSCLNCRTVHHVPKPEDRESRP